MGRFAEVPLLLEVGAGVPWLLVSGRGCVGALLPAGLGCGVSGGQLSSRGDHFAKVVPLARLGSGAVP